MSALAPTIEAFFTERLLNQRHASPRTIAAYRDTLRLLLGFARDRTGKTPTQLDMADLDAELVSAFLTHLEQQRHNSIRTRNARLAAIRSLFRFAALRHPEHAGLIQRVLAIPPKRYEHGIVSFLTPAEIDALLNAPDRSSWHGRRDHALLVLAAPNRITRLGNHWAHPWERAARHRCPRELSRQGTQGPHHTTDISDCRGAARVVT